MRRILAALLIFLMVIAPLSADKIEYEYEPYEEDEFPIWSHELRRAESIFFGSLVITFPVAMGVYSLASSLGMPTPNDDATKVLHQALIAGGLSLIIAGTDWHIGYLSDDTASQ